MQDIQNLDEFVNALTTKITNGIPESHYLKGEIEIELAIVSTKELGGKLSIFIAEAGGKYQKEELSKIKFKIAQRPSGGTVVVSSR